MLFTKHGRQYFLEMSLVYWLSQKVVAPDSVAFFLCLWVVVCCYWYYDNFLLYLRIISAHEALLYSKNVLCCLYAVHDGHLYV